ncbi:MAG: AtpZ/AtpI family protein [Acidobacteria bacterium]|nr:AtpZ/AtpI family protein [Acidobacteriota bacterium]
MLAEWSSIILLLPSAMTVGFFLGYWLDSVLGTSPWMKIACLLLGGLAGFYQTFRIVGRK